MGQEREKKKKKKKKRKEKKKPVGVVGVGCGCGNMRVGGGDIELEHFLRSSPGGRIYTVYLSKVPSVKSHAIQSM